MQKLSSILIFIIISFSNIYAADTPVNHKNNVVCRNPFLFNNEMLDTESAGLEKYMSKGFSDYVENKADEHTLFLKNLKPHASDYIERVQKIKNQEVIELLKRHITLNKIGSAMFTTGALTNNIALTALGYGVTVFDAAKKVEHDEYLGLIALTSGLLRTAATKKMNPLIIAFSGFNILLYKEDIHTGLANMREKRAPKPIENI